MIEKLLASRVAYLERELTFAEEELRRADTTKLECLNKVELCSADLVTCRKDLVEYNIFVEYKKTFVA